MVQLREVASDGNCFFHALGDQLNGGADHMATRATVMGYIEENRDMFQWFIEDDEPWGDYVHRMRQNKEWAGQLEVYAAACVYGVTLMIHQADAPRCAPPRCMHTRERISAEGNSPCPRIGK